MRKNLFFAHLFSTTHLPPFLSLRPLPASAPASTSAPTASTPAELHASTFPDAGLAVTATTDPASGGVSLTFTCDPPVPGRALHWGLDGWAAPDAAVWPAGTVAVDDKAVQTPFPADGSALTIAFPDADAAPSAVVFVLREPDGGWTSPSGGRDGRVPLRSPSASDVLARMVASEADPGASSLFTRFCAAGDLLDEAAAAGPPGVAALLTWLRLSSTRALPWYGGHCYQTKDAAHVQKRLVERVAALAAAGPPAEADPAAGEVRALARRVLATLPRGGGGGDDIRMGE
jgi:alpha-glucan, water dikinase